MAIERGFLDARTRALVSVSFALGRKLTMQIDTGFNGDILLGDITAAALGVVTMPTFTTVRLAGSAPPLRVKAGEIDIDWLGQRRRIDVLIFGGETPRRRGEPEGLLGTNLIHPNRLLID